MDFVIGGVAAAGACIFSNPFDVLKTRMQLQGELKAKGAHAVHYKNVLHAGVMVFKHEGVRGLQKGLSAAIVMHSVRNSVRLGLYQWLANNGFLTDERGQTVFVKSFAASAFSGAAGAFFGSPLFLIKTQLQAQAADTIAVGHQHRHKGAFTALRNIYNKQGVRGLWRGVDATMVRALAGSSAQLTTFAKVKDLLRDVESLKDKPVVISFVASIVGGIFQCIIMTPFDVVSTRLYNQGVDAHGRGLLYNGITDCFVKIGRTEGFHGFYKGVGANYMRLAPHGALCLVFWDMLKDLQGKYSNQKENR